MATVKGIWKFNDVLANVTVSETVNFTSNGYYVAISVGKDCIASLALGYAWGEYDENGELIDILWGDAAYCFEPNSGYGYEVGWTDESYKTIDFGETEQEVSDGFYDWLVENAVQVVSNIKIDITANGTTTLATAGKYCHRNIDVNVTVPDADTILDGSFSGEYVSDKITSLKCSAFEEMDGVTGVSLPNCTIFNGGKQFYYATNLENVYLPNLTTIENGNYTFGYTKIRELNLPNLTSLNGTVNPFYSMREVEKINLPKLGGTTIGTAAFYYTQKLIALILGGNALNPLGATNVFKYSSIANGTGYIYVPDDLVDSYKTATNWVTYADQIKPMSELEE